MSKKLRWLTESQIGDLIWESFNDKNRDHTKAPTVTANIIARFFDSEIIKDCNALNIRMWKAHIDDKTGELTSVELFENECPDERLNSKKLDHLLYESFK